MNRGEVEKSQITIGIIPLTDCAPIVVAKERGHFQRHGLDVTISREGAWASIRDKIAYGVLDAAHMLAPMPLASTLGIGAPPRPMITALSLNLGGNAITVSNTLYQRLCEIDPAAMASRPVTADALRQIIDADRIAGRAPLTLGVVFPTSTHNYQLRYWLAAAGIDPDFEVNLIVVPPPQMVDRLRRGHIDGFCVGEPWNSVAAHEGLGHVLVATHDLWNNHPEKVLGVSEAWAAEHPQTHQAILRAMLEAAAWLDEPANRDEAAAILAAHVYIDATVDVVRRALQVTPHSTMPQLVFHRYAATFPWRSHAMWFLTQMLRWDHLVEAVDLDAVAARVYRSDLYRQAASDMGEPVPTVDVKVEGDHDDPWTMAGDRGAIMAGPDRFFTGERFDPVDALRYLSAQRVRRGAVPMHELIAANS